MGGVNNKLEMFKDQCLNINWKVLDCCMHHQFLSNAKNAFRGYTKVFKVLKISMWKFFFF